MSVRILLQEAQISASQAQLDALRRRLCSPISSCPAFSSSRIDSQPASRIPPTIHVPACISKRPRGSLHREPNFSHRQDRIAGRRKRRVAERASAKRGPAPSGAGESRNARAYSPLSTARDEPPGPARRLSPTPSGTSSRSSTPIRFWVERHFFRGNRSSQLFAWSVSGPESSGWVTARLCFGHVDSIAPRHQWFPMRHPTMRVFATVILSSHWYASHTHSRPHPIDEVPQAIVLAAA